MNALRFLSLGLVLCITLLYSCRNDDSLLSDSVSGNVTFSLSPVDRGNNGGRTSSQPIPAAVIVSIKDQNGNLKENIKLFLAAFGQGYISDNLPLKAGDYTLTQFAILDVDNKIIYASPVAGSNLAGLVTNALPLQFTVSDNSVTHIVPEVLPVEADDMPSDFGYANFQFEIATGSSSVSIRTAVKIFVGKVLYEDVDATIRVSGYDATNVLKWSQDYAYTGPYAILQLKNGYHHYAIELINKWGTHDIQTATGKEIWDGRTDGTQPVTYVLGGTVKARKLKGYTISREVNVPGTGLVYRPESRNSYTYDADGRLESVQHENYNSTTGQFEVSSVDAFTYGDKLKILTTLNGALYSEYSYESGNGFGENKIIVINHFDNDKTWTLISSRNADSTNHVKANYSYSTGASFLYEFDFSYKNIITDKTTTNELCSYASYTYDKNISPFRHLGYMDFNFQNWPANNRLTEDSHYLHCGFPVLVPVSHAYTYDSDGYPLTKITTYRAGFLDGEGHPDGTLPAHSKTEFQYE